MVFVHILLYFASKIKLRVCIIVSKNSKISPGHLFHYLPLPVMQINKLIETGMLEEAHLNLLAMRKEFQREQEQCAEDSTMELAKKEKDLNLLYGELQKKIHRFVLDCKENLPSSVARIIQEEDKRSGELGGLQGSWMEAWRAAVREGVQLVVGSVPLEQREQNSSWLAVHLALLGKTIVEDLENVKRVLRWSYPPSFKVFSSYVRSYHQVVGQHLEKLEQRVTELKDLYALLGWIINTYKRSVRVCWVCDHCSCWGLDGAQGPLTVAGSTKEVKPVIIMH